jgi:uncharacterized membrane protein
MALLGDITALDWVALAWFLLAWLADALLIDGTGRLPRSLSAQMRQVRRFWMRRMLERDNRIFDSSLVGLSVQSIAFFASTTALAFIAVIGMLGAIDNVQALTGHVSLLIATSPGLLAAKLLLLAAVLVHAFFKFTWALRQFNYASALMGAAPMATAPRQRLAAYADHCADMLSFGSNSFDGGLRAYYFALALVAWIFHPVASIAATTIVLAVLLNRQFNSATFLAVVAELAELERKS